jgi:hypothetical protein
MELYTLPKELGIITRAAQKIRKSALAGVDA